MADKAKITGYRSEKVAIGTVKGSAAAIRIPINVAKPAIGAEVLVRVYGTEDARVFKDEKPTDEIAKAQTVYLYDPELK